MDKTLECVARAICQACEENPDHKGDAQGNAYRWQDYIPAAIAAMRASGAYGEKHDHLAKEVAAWRERFPNLRYRPQDDCVALK